MSAEPSEEIAASTADAPESDPIARAILRKGDQVEIEGHAFTLAMNAVIEGKRSEMLLAGLKTV
jgi:hypothetical protein